MFRRVGCWLLACLVPATASALPPANVQHLIVTTEPLVAEMQRLSDHWTGTGVNSSVVTLAWLQTQVEPGDDLAETLRNFIRVAHDEWGVASVVLGGNTAVVPQREARNTFYPAGGFTDIPTDLYFACLDGDWDADGDGIYGELEDEADLLPELSVGRAPVGDGTEAAVFVDKTLAYLAAAADPSPEALMLAEVLFPTDWEPETPPTFDGAEISEEYAELLEGMTPPFAMARRYENFGAYPFALPLSKDEALTAMSSSEFQLVHHMGNGYQDQMSMVDDYIRPDDVATLQNDVPFFLDALFPEAAALEHDGLLEVFLTHPDGGAAAALGASRAVFPVTAHEFRLYFYGEIAAGSAQEVGEALRNTFVHFAPQTAENTATRWQQMATNLLGDPLVTLGFAAAADIPPFHMTEALTLHPSSPNPFNPATSIRFRLGDRFTGAVRTTVRIHDFSGRVVATVIEKELTPGSYEIPWNGHDALGRPLASGSYLVVVRAGQWTASDKLTLLK